ncbi:SagB/ThcOx family dehydrogenase [Pseudomonas putida]|uniref:SagB/ThcOx family dehydrogenase n=1 Tax=Pseudomonas putida TaxID=303 RepID=A0A4D6X7V2_PSEPU|nr:SagB/ThcOx family dehydrogenase [Pseudomonas putida]QCI12054.1 SagB/ThcOx family dehydrogenase [Pseudomonas putida]
MSIIHDQYLYFTPHDVIDETLAFHAKGNYTIHRATQHCSTLHNIPTEALESLTGQELKLDIFSNPHDQAAARLEQLQLNHHLNRNNSCTSFTHRPLHFSTVQELLSPLLRKEDSNYRRGYPSGGAIYPIEVFCINIEKKVKNWPASSDALHLLPGSRKLEAHSPNINTHKLSQSITPENENIGSPTLALVYCLYLPKAVFKYRYRGYRLALLEAGSMYMLMDLRCKELNLNSRIWSGFTDHQLIKNLDLNPTLFLPACVQLIG